MHIKGETNPRKQNKTPADPLPRGRAPAASPAGRGLFGWRGSGGGNTRRSPRTSLTLLLISNNDTNAQLGNSTHAMVHASHFTLTPLESAHSRTHTNITLPHTAELTRVAAATHPSVRQRAHAPSRGAADVLPQPLKEGVPYLTPHPRVLQCCPPELSTRHRSCAASAWPLARYQQWQAAGHH